MKFSQYSLIYLEIEYENLKIKKKIDQVINKKIKLLFNKTSILNNFSIFNQLILKFYNPIKNQHLLIKYKIKNLNSTNGIFYVSRPDYKII